MLAENQSGSGTAGSNRQLMAAAMNSLAGGDGAPFVELMVEDFVWIIEGSTPWSGTYRGKADVRERLLGPLFGQFATRYRNDAERILSDGDHVVVQCRGDVETRSGKRYNNSYCYIIRMRTAKWSSCANISTQSWSKRRLIRLAVNNSPGRPS